MKSKTERQVKEHRTSYSTQKSNVTRVLPFPQARHLTRKERIALKAYQDYLLEKLPDQIERIVLFGSKARGDSQRDSDVDLLVNVNGPPIEGLGSLDTRWRAIVEPTFDFLMDYGVYISPTVMHVERVKEWTPLLAHIQKDGVLLWQRRKKKALS